MISVAKNTNFTVSGNCGITGSRIGHSISFEKDNAGYGVQITEYKYNPSKGKVLLNGNVSGVNGSVVGSFKSAATLGIGLVTLGYRDNSWNYWRWGYTIVIVY